MTEQKPQILLVDDNRANLVALRKLLSRMGADIVEASSGNEGLALCIDHDFALILLDVDMPVMDGYEVAEYLREEEKTSHIPIIFVTASYADDAHRLRGYGVGAVDYIQKPLDEFVLRSKVAVFLELDGHRQRLALELARSERMGASLRESERKFRNLVETTADFIWETDASDVFTYASPRSLAMFGRDAESLLGQTLHSLMPAEDASRLVAVFAEHSASCQAFSGLECRVFALDGRSVDTETSGQPIIDGDGIPHGFRGITRDITERKRAAAQLAGKSVDLERSNRELEQFAYVASHDLREPLRTVNAYVTLLERRYAELFDEDARQFIGFAKDAAVRMDRLILDLLEFSRIGRGTRPRARVGFQKVVQQALDSLRSAIEEAGAVITIQPDLPDLCGDAIELGRLVLNLLGNAVKYRAADRPPIISITCERQGNTWVFSFADNGIGIPEEQNERIFQIFQRLHTREEYSGTGIGLAVCKKIVERHGGRIWVVSELEKGSTFCFSLPVSV